MAAIKIIAIHKNIKCPTCIKNNVVEVEETINKNESISYGVCKDCKIAFDGDMNIKKELKEKKELIKDLDFSGVTND